ncbi:hypothetical protein DPX16_10988 [Anabarilius grahami]|uniref:Uncharacterized protein n=1 Tax=Anabarilius grahami TaxID=495550 RepID=A0A3N0Y9M5_ANAGA|nr:hypothetical protein DPX16_10988 [Anabarilius grahami]
MPGPFSLQRNIIAAPSNNLRGTFGSTDNSKAEVLWILHKVTKHHSFNSNSEISDPFQVMFPDLVIAKTFSCGPNKIAYVARFGLGEFIKRELIRTLTGPYVVMFNESQNQTTRTKQLDVHFRFWNSGIVKSRYFITAVHSGEHTMHKLFRDRPLASNLRQGSHLSWKTLKTWKIDGKLSSSGKRMEN